MTATVAAYSVVHGRDGEPEWGVAVCDLPGGGAVLRRGSRTPDLLAEAEAIEWVGRSRSRIATAP